MTTTKTNYLENTIRDGFTSEDVRMWQALCRQCETEVGDSVQYMWTILDMARHNKCGPIGIISAGRDVSEQKNVNEKFMKALMLAVTDDDDEPKAKAHKVLDLTAEDEDISGSYEEEENFYGDIEDNPGSADAYEIDGFVVADDDSEKNASTATCPHGVNITERNKVGCERCGEEQFPTRARALTRTTSMKKRVLESISEDE